MTAFTISFIETMSLSSITPPANYFPAAFTSADYDRDVNLIGNLIYLDGSLNDRLKHNLPMFKATSYETQAYNTYRVPVADQLKSAISMGEDFLGISDPKHFKIYLDLRMIEIAFFAANRFF